MRSGRGSTTRSRAHWSSTTRPRPPGSSSQGPPELGARMHEGIGLVERRRTLRDPKQGTYHPRRVTTMGSGYLMLGRDVTPHNGGFRMVLEPHQYEIVLQGRLGARLEHCIDGFEVTSTTSERT